MTSLNVALRVGNGSGLIRKSFLSKGGFLPPKSTVRLYRPTARYSITDELVICVDHVSRISCTCCERRSALLLASKAIGSCRSNRH